MTKIIYTDKNFVDSIDNAYNLAESIGLKCSKNTFPKYGSIPWEDGILHFGYSEILTNITKLQFAADIWHEIGHALVAPRTYWIHRGWGQGKLYDGHDGGPEYSADIAGDESYASAIGIWCQKYIAGDIEGSQYHSSFHDWCDDDPDYDPEWLSASYMHELKVMNCTSKNEIKNKLEKAGYKTPWD